MDATDEIHMLRLGAGSNPAKTTGDRRFLFQLAFRNCPLNLVMNELDIAYSTDMTNLYDNAIMGCLIS